MHTYYMPGLSLNISTKLEVAIGMIDPPVRECPWYSREASPHGFFRPAWCFRAMTTLQESGKRQSKLTCYAPESQPLRFRFAAASLLRPPWAGSSEMEPPFHLVHRQSSRSRSSSGEEFACYSHCCNGQLGKWFSSERRVQEGIDMSAQPSLTSSSRS